MKNTLIIPDTHFPFAHPDINDIIRQAIKDYQPEEVWFTGDLVDQYFASLFKKSPYAKSASEELKHAIKQLKQLYKVIGNLPVKVAIGNHDMRHLKRAFEANLPAELFLELKTLIEAPIHYQFSHKFRVGNVALEHGEGYSGQSAAMNLIKNLGSNAVIGHLHSQFSITYHNNGYKTFWAMLCGCLIDVQAYAFEYGVNCKDKPVCGLGLIIEDTPILLSV